MTLLRPRARSHFSPVYAGRGAVECTVCLALAVPILVFVVVKDMDVPPDRARDAATTPHCTGRQEDSAPAGASCTASRPGAAGH